MNNYDIAIVGNGIIGNSIGYALLQENPSLKICLIGPRSRPGSASAAAGAMINCFAELNSLSTKSEAGKAKFDLDFRSLTMWGDWLNSINGQLTNPKDHLAVKNGTFIIHNSVSGILDTRNYRDMIKMLDHYKEPYEWVDPSTIPGMNPMDQERSLEAIFLPNEGYISPQRLFSAFEKIFESQPNVSLIDSAAENIQKIGESFQIDLTNSQSVLAGKVVLAAGVYSQSLLDKIPEIFKKIPRLVCGVGNAMVLEKNPSQTIHHVIRTPNRSGACGLHVLPVNENQIYAGATNFVHFTPKIHPTIDDLGLLMQCLYGQIDQGLNKSRIIEFKTGNRPGALDGYPLIGETSLSGLWLVSGTYRDGIHKSPLISQHVAKGLLNSGRLIEHDLFAPERKFIRSSNRKESIDEGIVHYMAAAHERRTNFPCTGWAPMIEDMVRVRLEQTYDQLDTDIGLSPDILFMLDWSEDRTATINQLKGYLDLVS